MVERIADVYERVLRKRANRLGISVEAAKSTSGEKPLYLIAAEAAAARLKTTPEAVLQEDLRRIENSNYPTPACLTPDDLEDLLDGLDKKKLTIDVLMHPDQLAQIELGSPFAEQLQHLATCDACRTLLIACRPSEARLKEFSRFLEHEFQSNRAPEVSFMASRSRV